MLSERLQESQTVQGGPINKQGIKPSEHINPPEKEDEDKI